MSFTSDASGRGDPFSEHEMHRKRPGAASLAAPSLDDSSQRPVPIRVLVVDDDEFTLEATTMVLRKCGYSAAGCSSGDE